MKKMAKKKKKISGPRRVYDGCRKMKKLKKKCKKNAKKKNAKTCKRAYLILK